mmetsp:Transcript_54308/g.131790  ORF Transcript_54308/g.131790 Transcript_54308/m.131790 type:complete len:211 (-) Transcript_54308:656-1288(-)
MRFFASSRACAFISISFTASSFIFFMLSFNSSSSKSFSGSRFSISPCFSTTVCICQTLEGIVGMVSPAGLGECASGLSGAPTRVLILLKRSMLCTECSSSASSTDSTSQILLTFHTASAGCVPDNGVIQTSGRLLVVFNESRSVSKEHEETERARRGGALGAESAFVFSCLGRFGFESCRPPDSSNLSSTSGTGGRSYIASRFSRLVGPS